MLRKLMLVFTFLILIGVLITGLLSAEVARTYYYKSVEDKLLTTAKLIEQNLREDPENYEALCKKFGQIIEERVTVIGLDGTVLGDSEADIRGMENHSSRPEVIQALEKGSGKSVGVSGTLGSETLYIAIPLENRQAPLGVIRVALPLYDVAAIQQKVLYYTLLAVSFGILAALALGYRYLSTFTRPIVEMTVMASRIAGGRYDGRVQVKSKDEIGTLAATFNHMAKRMEHTVEELVHDKSKIEAILSSSVNGLIAVDTEGRVMFLNPNVEKILGIQGEESIGRSLFNLIKNKDAERILKDAVGAYECRTSEFVLDRPKKRIVKVITTPIKPKIRHSRIIGTLLIFQDVTTIHKLQKIRSDFVANVTHELKTPLTSIKGFVETLKEGALEDPDKRERFLEIIDIETERLERLIDDILLLSEIESINPYLQTDESVNVQEVIEDEILSMFVSKAAKKNISIETQFADNLPRLNISRDRFKQMLINLVDNAIKFTDKYGNVKILICANDHAMVIKVKDNGIGIPKEHQERIFERFYRGNKGRHNGKEGTGLGLAIVKHIVLSVKGTVEVDSRPGEGTMVSIMIPLKGEK